MSAPDTPSLLWGIGGTILGSVVGGLVLRGLGLGVLDARLKSLETSFASAHKEILQRLDRLEAPLISRGYDGEDRRGTPRAQ